MAKRYPGISRRQFLAGAVGTGGLVVLVACGNQVAQLQSAPYATNAARNAASPAAGGSAALVTAPPGATTRTTTPPLGTTVAAASVASGTVSSPASQIGQSLVVMAVEYGFQTDGSVPAGLTTIQLKNFGLETHEVGFVRLNEGATADQFRTAATTDEQSAYQLGTLEGGPNRIGPRGTSEVILNLVQGQYALACFVNTADGVTHASKGMIVPLRVTAATAPATPLPIGNGTVILGGNASEWPAMLPSGRSMYRVTNKADAVREFFIGRLATGKTVDDLQHALADPAANNPPDWFEAFGGMEGLKPTGMGIVILDLKPGNYAAVDNPLAAGEPTFKGYTVAG